MASVLFRAFFASELMSAIARFAAVRRLASERIFFADWRHSWFFGLWLQDELVARTKLDFHLARMDRLVGDGDLGHQGIAFIILSLAGSETGRCVGGIHDLSCTAYFRVPSRRGFGNAHVWI